jgi:two-component SAPR family response regulator
MTHTASPFEAPLVLLLVDDDDFVRETAAKSLSLIGYRVHTARCGQEALALFSRLQPHITLLDIHLPDLSGFSVLGVLRQSHPDAEIIFITGEGDMSMVINALRQGISDFVPKPLSLDTLLPVLESAKQRLFQKQRLRSLRSSDAAPVSVPSQHVKIKVKAFGNLVLTIGRRVISETDLPGSKAAAVLKILLIHHKRVVSVDDITQQLWGEVSQRSAEVMLFTAISSLRRLFEPNLRHGRDSKYILTHKSGYELNLGEWNVDYFYDVEWFDMLIREAARTRSAEKYLAAIDLYCDDFLAGDKAQEWSNYKRQMLKDAYLHALNFLAEKAQAEKNFNAAIEFAQKMLMADELYEPAYVTLIKSYLQLRRPSAAKKILELCEQNFRHYLGAPVPAYISNLLRSS